MREKVERWEEVMWAGACGSPCQNFLGERRRERGVDVFFLEEEEKGKATEVHRNRSRWNLKRVPKQVYRFALRHLL